MSYTLIENMLGVKAKYPTTLNIFRQADDIVFEFLVANSTRYCPYSNNNADLYEANVVEVFIANCDNPYSYLEIEIAPNGAVFCANVINTDGNLEFEYLEPFFQHEVTLTEHGYSVRIALNAEDIDKPSTLFNAFRIENDGTQIVEYQALNPTLNATFHRPERFKLLKDYISKSLAKE